MYYPLHSIREKSRFTSSVVLVPFYHKRTKGSSLFTRGAVCNFHREERNRRRRHGTLYIGTHYVYTCMYMYLALICTHSTYSMLYVSHKRRLPFYIGNAVTSHVQLRPYSSTYKAWTGIERSCSAYNRLIYMQILAYYCLWTFWL